MGNCSKYILKEMYFQRLERFSDTSKFMAGSFFVSKS